MKHLSFSGIALLCLVSLFCSMLTSCTENTNKKTTNLATTLSDTIPSERNENNKGGGPVPEPQPIPKKKIGIAFGGGGARAAVQIGVLKRLEELGIKADYVAGTSMGAVIAALYAAGYTTKQLDSLMKQDRDLWIYDKTKFLNLKKHDGRKVTGVIERTYFQKHLDSLLENKNVHLYRDFEKDKEHKIPFRCVATEFSYQDYKEVVCSQGVVAKDLTSSTSYPGAFVFSKNKGKYLLDGGMTNNLPVDVVRDMGAEIVIAIDLENDKEDYTMELISMGLYLCSLSDKETSSFIDKFSATRWFKDQKYLEKRKANIADADIYIHPSIGYNIKDYDALKISDMIKIGYNACRKDDIASKLEALK
ncbi:MAG: patatin-like phospholipase family protein [Prevotella sp.]|nr:patatin-like phospholipase family protein [Prevotella sp.]